MAMLHFNRILMNVSVRQNPRVSSWITTQQLAVANSTVSNSNQQLNPLLSITVNLFPFYIFSSGSIVIFWFFSNSVIFYVL